MSTNVDQRVVQMEFDNKNFEKNVGSTLGLLDKLKEKLRFDGATKGLENVESAAKKVNLSPVAKAAETISSKFSALEVMGVTALANITNSAVNAGKKIVAAFTIDPVKTGFQEYETQINAVQTILANTESKGSTLDDVNRALDTLNKYADMTIYNFTEMTRNIGTFTAAGVDLETSVSAIKGIANLAAVSGSTSQQASTAMYQLSQALAAGTVKLQDWNSVVNAGMGGQVFQDALKETARVHGIAIDQMIEQEGSFRETLKKGWITSEVLTETLSKFTGDLNESQLRTMGYTEEQIKSIIKMGQTANDAATKVKTFSQLFDTLKEAAQSGWTQTWELIVGDFEEAKAFLTMLSDRFSAIINKTSDARNNLLEGALSAKKVTMGDWKKLQNEGIASETFILALTNAAKKHGVAIDEMIEKEGSFQNTLKNGWLNFDILSSALNDYEDAVATSTSNMADKLEYFQSVVDKVWNGDYSTGAERIKALSEAGYDYATVQDLVNKTIDGHRLTLEDLSEAQMETLGFTEDQIKELKALKEQAEKTGTPLNELMEKLKRPAGRTLLIESLTNALDGLGLILSKIGKVWRAVFDPVTSDDLYGFIQRIHELSKKFAECNDFANKLARVFRGLFAAMDLVRSIVGGAVKTAFTVLCKLLGIAGDSVLDLAGGLADTVFYFNKWVKENDLIARGFNKLIDVISIAISTVSKWIDEIMKLPIVSNTVQKVKDAIGFFVADIRDYFQKGNESVKDFAENVGGLGGVNFDAITNKLTVAASKARTIPQIFTTLIESIQSTLTKFRKELNDKFSEIGTTFDSFGKRVASFVDYIRDKFSNLTFGKVFATASIIGLVVSAKKIGDAIEALAAPLEALTGILETFEKVEKAAVKLINSISSAFKSVSHVLNAAALIEMAVAVSIFAGAIALLAKIDDQDRIGNAVGALSMLMVVMTGLFAVVAAFGTVKKTSVQQVAIVLATLGAAVLALAGALKILDGLNDDTIVKNAVVLGGLATALVTLVGVLGKFVPQLTKGSITFVAVAASVKILVEALATLDTLNTDTVMNNATAMLKIMTTLVILMRVCGKVRVGAAVTLISLVVSLKMLLKTFDDLAEIDPITIEKSLAAIKRIFESFALVMIASKLAGENAGRAGVGIFAMSTALLVISGAIAIIGNMDTAVITRATMVIKDIFVMFALLTAASALAGKNAARAGTMMLLMSGSLLILTGVIAILTQIGKESPDAMNNAVEAIMKLELCFTLLIAVSKLAAGSKGTIIALSVTIGILSATLAALSIIKPEGLYPATVAISALMGMLALVVASTHLAQKSIATLITVTAVVGVLAVILAKLNGLDANTAIATAGSLSILLLSLSAACAILATLGKSSGAVVGALAGAAALDAMIVIIGGLMVGLGALFSNENLEAWEGFLDKGIVILQKIGYGLGSFVGNIVGGFAGGAFAAVGQGLSDFMTNLQGFIDGAKQIDDGVVNGVKGLAETLLILTGTNILNGIATLFGAGSSSLAAFAWELSEAGPALAKYAESVKGVDFSGVEASANAGRMMAEFAKNIPNEGGLLARLVGDNNVVTFAWELYAMADGLVGYANKVRGVSFDNVEASANAALLLANFAKNIPNSGGILAKLVGDNYILPFALQLYTLADPLVRYANKVSGVSFDNVEASANAATMIAEFAKKIPNSGGLLAGLVGDNKLYTFAIQLAAFAIPFVAYAKIISSADINYDTVERSATAAQSLAALESALPKHYGALSIFFGDNTLSTFGYNLQDFGYQFKKYYGYIKDIKPDVVESTKSAAESLATLAKNLPEDKAFKSDTIDCFGKDLAKFGKKFAEYYKSIEDINVETLSAVVKETENVIKMAKGTASVDTTKFGSFGEALTKVGGNGLNSFIKSFSDASSKIESAGKKVLDDFIKGINSKKDTLVTAFKNLMTAAVEKLNSSRSSFGTVGKSVIDDMISGANQKKTSLVNAFYDLIKASATKVDESKTSFETAGKNFIAKLESGIKSKASSLKNAVTNLIKDVIKKFDDYEDDAYDAGEDFVKGFAKGIDENTFRAEAKAKAMAKAAYDAAKKELDEHSPSRKMFEVGEYYSEGFALGIDSKQSTVKKSATKVANLSIDPLRKMAKTESEILNKSSNTNKSYWNDRLKTTKTGSSKIITVFGETIEKVKDKSSDGLSSITDIFSKGEDTLSKGLEKVTGLGTDSLNQQTSYWSNSTSVNQNGVSEVLSTQDDLLEGLETTSEQVEEIHEDDLANETGYWADLLRIKRQGAEAEKYQAMSLAEFQKETLDKTLELYNNYYDELNSKTQSFMNSTSLFNAVSKSEEEIGKGDLVTNLKDQVNELYEYGTVMAKLEKRLADTNLWEYVKDLGADSTKELQAINSMTDAELSRYVEIYETKYTLANACAKFQLKDLKESTELSLDELYDITGTKLEDFSKTFDGTLESITAYVEKAAEIGANISAGVATGMADNTEEIDKAAKKMIDNAEEATKEAAEIHSPSERFRREVGVNIIKGIALGIETMKDDVPNSLIAIMDAALTKLRTKYENFKMVGASLVDGLIDGIRSKTEQALAEARSLAESVSSAINSAMSSVDLSPTITPKLDLSESALKVNKLDVSYSTAKASSIGSTMNKTPAKDSDSSKSKSSGNSYNFTQNNYSPKSLSSTDIYRQTKNQFAAMERMLEA